MEALYFCLTMDCERILAESPPGGPPDWEFSRRSIEGFRDILSSESQRATFFIVPETASKHADLWHQMAPEECELGLHVHPQSLGDHRWTEYLGSYSAEIQMGIIEEAMDAWSDALGTSPHAFRPGNFSASDATFRVLCDLEFTHGSVSAPGRCLPEFAAVWTGAPPFVHRAHPWFRMIEGKSDFLEAPTTEDQTRYKKNSPERVLPHELRVEWGDPDVHSRTLRNAVQQMLTTGREPFALIAITHNHIDYFNPDSSGTRNLRAMIRIAREAAREQDLELLPATIGQIRDAFLEMEAL